MTSFFLEEKNDNPYLKCQLLLVHKFRDGQTHRSLQSSVVDILLP